MKKPKWLELVHYERIDAVSKAIPFSLRVELRGVGLGFNVRMDWSDTPSHDLCSSCRKPFTDEVLGPQLPHATPGICCECVGNEFGCDWKNCVPWYDLAHFTEGVLLKAGLLDKANDVHFAKELAEIHDDDTYISNVLEDAIEDLARIQGPHARRVYEVVSLCVANETRTRTDA